MELRPLCRNKKDLVTNLVTGSFFCLEEDSNLYAIASTGQSL